MTENKTNLLYIVVCCCFLLAPGVLYLPVTADTSGNSSKLVITAEISLASFNFTITDIGRTQATITWQTNDNTAGTVQFGPTAGYGFSGVNGTIGKYHSVPLTGLSPGTVYHYRAISVDSSGHQSVGPDSTFTTSGVSPGVTGSPGKGGGGGSNTYTGNPGGMPSGTGPSSPGAGSPLPAAAAAIAVCVYLRNKKPPE